MQDVWEPDKAIHFIIDVELIHVVIVNDILQVSDAVDNIGLTQSEGYINFCSSEIRKGNIAVIEALSGIAIGRLNLKLRSASTKESQDIKTKISSTH